MNDEPHQLNFGHAQKENDDMRIEVLKQRVFDGKLIIKDTTLRDLSFLENLNVQILDIDRGSGIIPKFTCQTLKELRMYGINFENFMNINLENLETLKISHCNLNECEYFSKVLELELDNVQNAEYILSKQMCKTIKKLKVTFCSVTSLNSLQLENVEVLYIKDDLTLNIENIRMYQHLKVLYIGLYSDIDTTPLQHLTKLTTVKFEYCNNIIINLNSESIKNFQLNNPQQYSNCTLKSVDSFQLPNIEILGIQCFSAVYNFNKFQNLKELDLSKSQGLDLSLLQDLTSITSLNFSCCNLRDTTNMSEQAVQKLKYIKTPLFEVKENYYIDIAPLKFLVQLEKLNMNHCELNKIDVLSYLTNLKELELADNDNIDDITPLSNLLQLRILNLQHCCLTNVEALQFLQNLEELNLANNFNINKNKVIQHSDYLDTTPLQYLTKLTILNLNSCDKLQLSFLSKLTNLDQLNLSFNFIQDIRPLQHLNLKQLNLSGTEFDDIQHDIQKKQLFKSSNSLKVIRAQLQQLILKQHLSRKGIDIDALFHQTSLTILDLSKCKLSSLNALQSLVNLKELNLSRDLSYYEMEQIKNLLLDITPLQYLTQLEKLEISQCGLQSVEPLIPLQKLKVLNLRFNLIVYALPLAQLKQLTELQISSNKIIDFTSQFVKFFDLDSYMATCNEQPTEQEIQYANILRDVNSPVSSLRNMSEKRKLFKNIVVGKKNYVNMRIQEQNINLNSFFGKVIILFQQLNADNIQ
ncbi:leucine-rich_repeat domain-containing protein [Hexamita inflata]|uniref:Leucine-rich repeat domain-containing protein n=1 Tax=Hexamita inflata TaxID=28002 RepID=A0AA86V006_9EUKA|nr:leucine-rich repeat domain-containing protein [Hexamita inflata]